jgi:hypothetical protein
MTSRTVLSGASCRSGPTTCWVRGSSPSHSANRVCRRNSSAAAVKSWTVKLSCRDRSVANWLTVVVGEAKARPCTKRLGMRSSASSARARVATRVDLPTPAGPTTATHRLARVMSTSCSSWGVRSSELVSRSTCAQVGVWASGAVVRVWAWLRASHSPSSPSGMNRRPAKAR